MFGHESDTNSDYLLIRMLKTWLKMNYWCSLIPGDCSAFFCNSFMNRLFSGDSTWTNVLFSAYSITCSAIKLTPLPLLCCVSYVKGRMTRLAVWNWLSGVTAACHYYSASWDTSSLFCMKLWPGIIGLVTPRLVTKVKM